LSLGGVGKAQKDGFKPEAAKLQASYKHPVCNFSRVLTPNKICFLKCVSKEGNKITDVFLLTLNI
jgi:hypothetical protein